MFMRKKIYALLVAGTLALLASLAQNIGDQNIGDLASDQNIGEQNI
jgi:hypothetical protein